MTIQIQKIKLGKNEVMISIGYFLAGDFEKLEKISPRYIEAYEPRKKTYERYLETLRGLPALNIKCIEAAVGSKEGEATLQDRSTKSTICSAEDSPNSYTVSTLSINSILSSVIDRYQQVDRLLINCEGSEIDIINNVDIELLKKCKYIFVQFHDFILFLNITPEDIQGCIKIFLDAGFDMKCLHRRYSKYEFTRKE